MPRGALWCLVLVACAELVFRLQPRSFFLTMDQHDYGADRELDYTAVGLAASMMPPADVVVVGTSRAREAVQSPDLAAQLRRSLPDPIEVRNYGTAAGRVDVWLALFERLVREGKQPRVLVVALDGSDFRDVEATNHRYGVLDLAGMPADIARNGWPGESDMTSVLGNSFPLWMVRARPAVGHLVRHGEMGAGSSSSAFGGTTVWAREWAAAATRGTPPPMLETKQLIRRTRRGYVVHERGIDRLRELVDLAASHGVNVVLAQIPESPPVRSAAGVRRAQKRLRAELRALAGDHTWVWTSEAAVDDFGTSDYRDPSHLNARGALRFVGHIAPLVAEAIGHGQPRK